MKTIQSINNGTLANILEAAVSERDQVKAWIDQRSKVGDLDVIKATQAVKLAIGQVQGARAEMKRRFPSIPHGVSSSTLAGYARKWPDKIGTK